MKSIIALVFLLAATACCHRMPHVVQSAPPSAGFTGLVVEGRPVTCWADDDMPEEKCKIVYRAILEINRTVGYQLLAYKGVKKIGPETQVGSPEEPVTVVGATEMEAAIGGKTLFLEGHAGYLNKVIVVFNTLLWLMPDEVQYGVILHEMCHSVGMEHADADSMFDSNMKPVNDPNVSRMTDADAAALRDAYSR